MAYMDLPLDAPCKPNKGHEGGACNRQSCQAEPALWFNHGSNAWYCEDCRNDIEFDDFNLRDWRMNWQPKCYHPMFETRSMMMERELSQPIGNKDRPDIWDEPIEYRAEPRRSRRSGFASVAGMALAAMATPFATSGGERCFVHDPDAKRAAYTSEKPLTKRQKRRLRGKALKGEPQ